MFILNFLIIFSFVVSFIFFMTIRSNMEVIKKNVNYDTISEEKKNKFDKILKNIENITFWIMLIDFSLLVAQIIT